MNLDHGESYNEHENDHCSTAQGDWKCNVPDCFVCTRAQMRMDPRNRDWKKIVQSAAKHADTKPMHPPLNNGAFTEETLRELENVSIEQKQTFYVFDEKRGRKRRHDPWFSSHSLEKATPEENIRKITPARRLGKELFRRKAKSSPRKQKALLAYSEPVVHQTHQEVTEIVSTPQTQQQQKQQQQQELVQQSSTTEPLMEDLLCEPVLRAWIQRKLEESHWNIGTNAVDTADELFQYELEEQALYFTEAPVDPENPEQQENTEQWMSDVFDSSNGHNQ